MDVFSVPGQRARTTDLEFRALWRRLRGHIGVPLHRDGYALALNSALTAAMGLAYWILAAQTYSAHAVGLNSALISSMMFLAGIASLNLPNVLVRFLPGSGARTLQRVLLSYSASLGVAACAGVVFIVGVGGFAPRLAFLRSDHGLQTWFLLSTLAWCVFALQDSVLIALRRAVLVPVENSVFAVLKVVLLVALAGLAPTYGVFVSWTIAMLVSVAGVNLYIFIWLLRRRGGGAAQPTTVLRDRHFARYFAADYGCSVAYLSTVNLLPVIITASAGATANAYWALAYAVAMPFYVFGQNIGTSLVLHGTGDLDALPALTRAAARQGIRLLIPCVVLLALAAPWILSLFGTSYAHRGTTVLRLMMVGALPNFVLSLGLSVARVRRRLRPALIALGAEAVLTLGLAAPMLHAIGVAGVALLWLLVQTLVATGLLVAWMRDLASGAIVSSAAVTADPPRWEIPGPSDVHPLLARLFARCEARELRWMLLRMPSDPLAPTGDVDLLVHPDDAHLLRQAAAEIGFAALPGWDSAPDLIMMRFDRASRRWLVLDVSTSISFHAPAGPELEATTDAVLDRRRRVGSLVMADPADAFWLVLLHCLLDKERVSEHRYAELSHPADGVLSSPLALAVQEAASSPGLAAELVEHARHGQWTAVEDAGTRLRAELRRNRSVACRLSSTWATTKRIARRPFLLRRRRGLSLALLGPNGVGKSTAAAGLRESFPFEARIVYMGVWKERQQTHGRIGTALEILSRPARIWFRYAAAQYHLLRGRLVIFDRYVYEARLPARPPLLALKRPYFWLVSHIVPPASVVAVLDVPGGVAYARKQENPPEELEQERRLYAAIAARLRAATVIDAGGDASAVGAELNAILWQRLARRWGAEA